MSTRFSHHSAWAAVAAGFFSMHAGMPCAQAGEQGRPSAHAAAAAPVAEVRDPGDVNQWLRRINEASRQHSYMGTVVVLTATGDMSSSRIWHAGSAQLQVERVDALTGMPRTTLRRNDQVIT
ncbi:MAG TPA: sigma-E factor regulatory protein RseB domain-containing protein, partial [Burkholderiaceae bacterium]